uniref:EXPERA domain-containing protein n=1 Tax=Macrostomum lignano TaxID=282301 RepID=A0A1I8HHW4_9PLAT
MHVPLLVLMCSVSAVPISFICNHFRSELTEPVILAIGVAVLSAICFIIWLGMDKGKPIEPLYFPFALGCFGCAIDMVISMDMDGFVDGFADFYLEKGESYLKTSHGLYINYWDGVVHYAQYLYMVTAIYWNGEYRHTSLYWFGSMMNSIIVLLCGAACGPHQLRPALLLNVPFALYPLYVLHRALRTADWSDAGLRPACLAGLRARRFPGLADACLALACIATACLCLLRAVVAVGCNHPVCRYLAVDVDPYSGDAERFPLFQLLTYAYFLAPFLLAVARALLAPATGLNIRALLDWSLVAAGAVAQGQFSYTLAPFHLRTPFARRVPSQAGPRAIFLAINLCVALVPHLVLLRLRRLSKDLSVSDEAATTLRTSDSRKKDN